MAHLEKDWHMFVTIAETNNLTKAATQLYMSQPALSYRLTQLEKQFDEPLFIRMPRGVIMTEMGELYYEYAEDMLKRKEYFESSMENKKNSISGVLSLGCSSIFANYELPSILEGFTKQYPNVRIQLKTGISSKISNLYQACEVHIAIIRGPLPTTGETYLINRDPICLVTNKQLHAQSLPRTDLITLPLIRYATARDLYTLIDTWWKEQYNVPPNDSIHVDTMATCRQFIRKNLGWSILPKTGLSRFIDEFYIEPLHWSDGSPILRDTHMIYNPTTLHRKPVQAFVDYIQQFYASAQATSQSFNVPK